MSTECRAKLRGRIIEKFGTIQNFADYQGISRGKQFIGNVLNGKAVLTFNDIEEWIYALQIEPDEIYFYFFAH